MPQVTFGKNQQASLAQLQQFADEGDKVLRAKTSFGGKTTLYAKSGTSGKHDFLSGRATKLTNARDFVLKSIRNAIKGDEALQTLLKPTLQQLSKEKQITGRDVQSVLDQIHNRQGTFAVDVSDTIHGDLTNDLQKEVSMDTELGVTQQFVKDANRHELTIGGSKVTRNAATAAHELKELCTDDDGKLDQALLTAVSKVACQTSPNGLFAAMQLGHGAPHMPGWPVTGDQGSTHWGCSISRLDNGDIKVDFHFEMSGIYQLTDVTTGDMTTDNTKFFDDSQSSFEASWSTVISKENVDNGSFDQAVQVSDVTFSSRLVPSD